MQFADLENPNCSNIEGNASMIFSSEEIAQAVNNLINKKHLSINDLKNSLIWDDVDSMISKGITHPRQILFHYINPTATIPICQCGKLLSWHPDKREYRQYCSVKCSTTYTVEQKKANNLKKFGKEWHSQTNEWKDKVKETSLRKFGEEHYSKTQEFLDRTKSTTLQNYGVEHPAQSEEISEKIRSTCQERYGTDSPLESSEIKDKIKQTVMDRYGYENVLSSPEIQSRIQQTNLDRYQFENAMQNSLVSSKASVTRKINHYGADTFAKINDPVWLQEQNSQMPIRDVLKQLDVITHSTLCKYYHKNGIQIQRYSVTELEQKLYEYFLSKGIQVILNDRTAIGPKEIDLFFPDFMIGVEINGGYWHTEQHRPNWKDHLNKLEFANNIGIDLMHFWDWEINDNWDLIVGKIEYKLGLSKKEYARKTKLKMISPAEKSAFLITNHIQGDCQSKINIGLFNEQGNLVMVGTFGKSRFDKKSNWELLRLASGIGISVTGGASKILSFFTKNYLESGEKLISYCQRRFGQGIVYNNLGFTKSHITDPGYIYVKRGLPEGSRLQWQKHKLKEKLPIFDEKLSAGDNMRINGYFRAWDCGQIVFTLTKE